MALIKDKPAALASTSSEKQVADFEKWETSNMLGIMIIQKAMTENVSSVVDPGKMTAKEYLVAIGEKYKEFEKAETNNYLSDLMALKYDGTCSIREHILKFVHINSKLKALNINMEEEFLVHLALNSLPSQFAQLKVSYNIQKETWSMNDVIT